MPRYTLPMDITVAHETGRSAFTVNQDGVESILEYTRLESGTVAFVHTFVPPALRGRGIAEQLVSSGLGWARGQGLRVLPSCSYVAAYMARHPEWDDLRQKG